jgi:hypothetical protein
LQKGKTIKELILLWFCLFSRPSFFGVRGQKRIIFGS